MELEKYSFGTGDRFGKQGSAQLQAIRKAQEQGVNIAIVWNKSHREHLIVGTSQVDVRREADVAVKNSGWSGGYYVDADHIGLSTVENFLDHSDFFTLDVADYIGEKADEKELSSFVESCSFLSGHLHIEGIEEPLNLTREKIRDSAEKYLFAVQRAAEIYNYIESVKGKDRFITEVSMDETEEPQTPEELLFILAALAGQKVPAQTIAPKFTGRFNKGIDYQGDVEQFNREFSDDICVIRHAVSLFDLPKNLKLSVHSGSDKFSIYPGIRKAIELHDAGVHVKTAGTTWLEELIGLAESGGSSLELVKDIYTASFSRFDELCGPYASVIDIERNLLPSPEEFSSWNDQKIARSIRHDMSCSDYDKNIRQLLHVGYKVAAEYGTTYLQALETHKDVIGRHVCTNLFEKHLTPLFL
ncbi:MAG: tagaturonate epimerase family protein [Desulfofustis sp.]